jgi:hypothetical protein
MQAIYVSTGQSLEKSDVLSGKLPLRRGLDAQRKSLGIRFRQRARLLRSLQRPEHLNLSTLPATQTVYEGEQ